ncbi:MAG: Flp family type IVb pilin [Henriciella sp.]
MLKLIVKGQDMVRNLRRDTRGASLIEYSILIGLITAAVIATIVLVGGKVTGAWNTLNGNWT